MQGIEAFNITLVGTNFPVQQIDLDDFDFGEAKPKVQFRLEQVMQVAAGEFMLQVLPDRFTISAQGVSPDSDNIAILKRIANSFVELYSSKRSILAAGHNFGGTFVSSLGSSENFMRHIAWRSDFASAFRFTSEPTFALGVSGNIAEEETLTVRLEPRVNDKSRVFYDFNFNWGGADKPLQKPVVDVIEEYGTSLDYAGGLIDRLRNLGATSGEGQQ